MVSSENEPLVGDEPSQLGPGGNRKSLPDPTRVNFCDIGERGDERRLQYQEWRSHGKSQGVAGRLFRALRNTH